MWLVIRFCTWISDVTLVTSQVMKVRLHHPLLLFRAHSVSERASCGEEMYTKMPEAQSLSTKLLWQHLDSHQLRLVLQRELAEHKCTAERIQVWQRGVDTVRFNPSYRCDEMRGRLSEGHPEAPLLVHVGRLGAGLHPVSLHTCPSSSLPKHAMLLLASIQLAHLCRQQMCSLWCWLAAMRVPAVLLSNDIAVGGALLVRA